MVLHKNPNFRIYIGDSRDTLYPAPAPALPWQPQHDLLNVSPFSHLKKCMMLDALVCAQQVHGTNGVYVTRNNPDSLTSFIHNADFLITNERRIGIGVLTADCVPLIMHDAMRNVIAIVHAGWRGAVSQIAVTAFNALKQHFNAQEQGMRVFMGPSAGVCCYKVDEPFIEAVRIHSYADKALIQRNKEWFFDLPLFNKLQLEAIGIPRASFRMQYNTCTICSPQFFSYRRQQEKAGRQLTVVSLV